MDYALLPFPVYFRSPHFRTGLPDLRHVLEQRKPAPPAGLSNLDLLNYVVECLRELSWEFYVDHCAEEDGDLHLSIVAEDLQRELDLGDDLKAGFCLRHSESGRFETLAATRIFRVVCANGAILECEQEQAVAFASDRRPAQWQLRLRSVIERSFSAAGIDLDTARFRVTTQQMVVTPYEFLCNLVAQGLISEDEQADVTAAFYEAGDMSLYGIVNAVTQMAHRLRADNGWTRAIHFERLGGEIVRGDHRLLSYELVPV